jgi:hypothetical protein
VLDTVTILLTINICASMNSKSCYDTVTHFFNKKKVAKNATLCFVLVFFNLWLNALIIYPYVYLFYYKYLQVTLYYCYDTVTLFLSALSITVSNSPFSTAKRNVSNTCFTSSNFETTTALSLPLSNNTLVPYLHCTNH